jgi:prolyl-tRNA synthetase
MKHPISALGLKLTYKDTTTVEGYIPSNGRGIQGATSHCLGQNFSKMFDITVEDPDNKGKHVHVWQNS